MTTFLMYSFKHCYGRYRFQESIIDNNGKEKTGTQMCFVQKEYAVLTGKLSSVIDTLGTSHEGVDLWGPRSYRTGSDRVSLDPGDEIIGTFYRVLR